MRNLTVFIQNIITPYRSCTFNKLYQYDQSYIVYYMSKTERDRNWDISKINIKHKYWLDKFGIYFMFKGYHIHINPILILKVLFNRNIKNIILCVSYNDLNIIILALIKHLHLTHKNYYCWAEANYLTNGARQESKFKNFLRKFVYSSIDKAAIVPGEMAKLSFKHWGINFKKFIDFPNTIDESSLEYSCENNRSKNQLLHFFMPVRLIENVKGILNFFNAIGIENIRKSVFLIAGDGIDRHIYEKYIFDNKLQEHIKLLGFCDAKLMTEYYNNSNILLLPSFSDPSPLSIIEALYFHLPILCSSHCGNHYEAVIQGENGYTFSPFNKDEIKQKYIKILESRDKLGNMGETSFYIYNEKFNLDKVVLNLIHEMNI